VPELCIVWREHALASSLLLSLPSPSLSFSRSACLQEDGKAPLKHWLFPEVSVHGRERLERRAEWLQSALAFLCSCSRLRPPCHWVGSEATRWGKKVTETSAHTH
jgi:hypothetical protein